MIPKPKLRHLSIVACAGILGIVAVFLYGSFGTRIPFIEGKSDYSGLTYEQDSDIGAAYRVVIRAASGYRVLPGTSFTHTVTIVNQGFYTDTYTITPTAKRRWAAFTSVPLTITLAPDETYQFAVPVNSPLTLGAREEMRIKVRSHAMVGLFDALTTVIEVVPSLPMNFLVPAWSTTYTGLGNGDDLSQDIELDDEGNVYVTGRSLNALGKDNITTTRYTADGPQA